MGSYGLEQLRRRATIPALRRCSQSVHRCRFSDLQHARGQRLLSDDAGQNSNGTGRAATYWEVVSQPTLDKEEALGYVVCRALHRPLLSPAEARTVGKRAGVLPVLYHGWTLARLNRVTLYALITLCVNSAIQR